MDKTIYSECRLCPRSCSVNRHHNTGYCKMPDIPLIARAALHMWEEPCISGESGSGTVFFCGCSLRCVYCQNYGIASSVELGKSVDENRLSEIFLELQASGANNINLVTATHYVPHVVEAVKIARQNGLTLPIVYNTSGYETIENIDRLNGTVDVYLPDFKYSDDTKAKKYSNAPNYPEVALSAIKRMVEQVGKPQFSDGLIKKGVIVRHLVLPGNIKASKKALELLHNEFGDDIYISIMKQYTPMPQVNCLGEDYRELTRKLTKGEYDSIVRFAMDIGIANGFIQYGENADESFIPEFNGQGV